MIRIEILGALRITGDALMMRHSHIPTKTQALMVYLTLTHNRTQSREKLVDLLWPHQGTDSARHSLRNALTRAKFYSIFDADFTTVRLTENVQTDVGEFLAGIFSANIEELGAACSLIRGPLDIPTIDSEPWNEWLDNQRVKFDELYTSGLTKLSSMQTVAGSHEAAIRTAQRAIELNNFSERAHQTLIAAYTAAGCISDAAKHYRKLQKFFTKELGVAPSKETQQLLRDAVGEKPEMMMNLQAQIASLTSRIVHAEAEARTWHERYNYLNNVVQRARRKAAEKRAAASAAAAAYAIGSDYQA